MGVVFEKWKSFSAGVKAEGLSETTADLIFNLLITLMFIYCLIDAMSFPPRAIEFPLVASVAGLISMVLTLAVGVRKIALEGSQIQSKEVDVSELSDLPPDQTTPVKTIYARGIIFIFWIVGYYIVIGLAGMLPATILLFVLYIRIVGHGPWLNITVLTVVSVYVVFGIFGTIFDISFPSGLLDIPQHLPVPGFF